MSKFGSAATTSDFGTSLTSLDYWRLCDELTVVQASLLVVGINPSEDAEEDYVEQREPHNQPPNYRAARAALLHAIIGKRLPARIVYRARDRRAEGGENYGLLTEDPLPSERIEKNALVRVNSDPVNLESFVPSPELVVDTDPDLSRTTVMVDALRVWLRSRGLRQGFFFPQKEEEANYLNSNHPRYAPKLAASIRAWQAVEHPEGKSPKNALVKWLREHAPEFGLTDAEGKQNDQGIEECAKVANWELKGGAPKTPEVSSMQGTSLKAVARSVTAKSAFSGHNGSSSKYNSSDMDDDIPF